MPSVATAPAAAPARAARSACSANGNRKPRAATSRRVCPGSQGAAERWASGRAERLGVLVCGGDAPAPRQSGGRPRGAGAGAPPRRRPANGAKQALLCRGGSGGLHPLAPPRRAWGILAARAGAGAPVCAAARPCAGRGASNGSRVGGCAARSACGAGGRHARSQRRGGQKMGPGGPEGAQEGVHLRGLIRKSPQGPGGGVAPGAGAGRDTRACPAWIVESNELYWSGLDPRGRESTGGQRLTLAASAGRRKRGRTGEAGGGGTRVMREARARPGARGRQAAPLGRARAARPGTQPRARPSRARSGPWRLRRRRRCPPHRKRRGARGRSCRPRARSG
jgi:hypothetical protein